MGSFFNKFQNKFDKMQFNVAARTRLWRKLRVNLNSGTGAIESLNMLWDNMSDDGKKPNHPVAKIIAEWKKSISNGSKLGDAIKGWVPEGEQTIISAGEESNLIQAIDDLLKIQAAKKKIKSTILKGVIYPIVLLIAGCGFLIMFSVRVAPQFNDVLPREKWTGPPVVMVNAGDFFTNYLFIISLVLIALFFTISWSMGKWTGRFRIYADKIPPWSLYRLYSGSSFLLILSAMLSAGVSPLKIIDTVRKSASPWLDERLAATERFIRGGKNIGDALFDTGFDYPDKEMVRDIRSYASKAEFADILRNTSDDWIETSIEKIEMQFVVIKNVAMVFATGVIIGFLMSIFSLEQQVLDAQQSSS